MSAQLVVKKGIRWRVGNGKSIQIWSDDWLPSCSYPRILSPTQAQWVSAKVSDLIVEDRGEWNLAVVRHLFNPVETDLVMSIPLSQRLPVDRVVWGGTRNGKFSVCSAYHSTCAMENSNKEECSDASEMKKL